MTHDDKPLTQAQARQKLQKGLEEYLAGNDTGPIVFRPKRTKNEPAHRRIVVDRGDTAITLPPLLIPGMSNTRK